MSPPPSAPVPVRVRRTRAHAQPLPLPAYQTEGSSGLDLLADVDDSLTLKPGQRMLVPTGLALEIPPGFEAQVRSRSGLAFKNGVVCLNSPGTIDADYRGELKVILGNLSDEPWTLRRGDRIAQLVVAPVTRIRWNEAESLGTTDRGAGGFGSTGI